jgi:hypothetical protein
MATPLAGVLLDAVGAAAPVVAAGLAAGAADDVLDPVLEPALESAFVLLADELFFWLCFLAVLCFGAGLASLPSVWAAVASLPAAPGVVAVSVGAPAPVVAAGLAVPAWPLSVAALVLLPDAEVDEAASDEVVEDGAVADCAPTVAEVAEPEGAPAADAPLAGALDCAKAAVAHRAAIRVAMVFFMANVLKSFIGFNAGAVRSQCTFLRHSIRKRSGTTPC